MKKSLLALAVLGAFAGAAQAQSSVTIYGIVDTGIVYSSKVATGGTVGNVATGSRFQLSSGNVQGSRIGFKGVEDLGGGLSAVFNLETGFDNDTGALNGQDKSPAGTTNLFRRKSVVGLQGGFGAVLLGRQTDFLDDLGGALTSVGDFGGWTGNVGNNLNRLEGTRTNNSIRYNTNNLGGFTGSLIYGFGETAGQTSAGQSFGAGLKYENGPLALGAAYYQAKVGKTASDTSLLNNTNLNIVADNVAGIHAGDIGVKTFALNAKYTFGNAAVYGGWSRTKQPWATGSSVAAIADVTKPTTYIIGGLNNDKTDTFELGGSYNVSPALKLMAAIDYSRINYVASPVAADPSKGRLIQYSLGADYFLSKRTDLYAMLGFLSAKDTLNPGISGGTTGSDSNQTALAVGIRHKF
ncbi:porin [Herbaspirillum sp.]|uniref:porin n=1 Tax=Herbaspirillum sp. TaxID=1890675 RepID=UPI001B2BDE4D|nr:porin [Herbaspirillum sp.]MBO9536471.1 porin [Herbaspirillum sp.]